MFIEALFTIAKTRKQPKCPSTDEWIKKIWCVCMYIFVCMYVCVCVYIYIYIYIYIYTHVCIHTHTQWNITQPIMPVLGNA